MRPHRVLESNLGRALADAGAEIDIERVVPTLYTWVDGKCIEANLDIVYAWPGRCYQQCLDVSIRCPHSERHPDAHQTAGSAAKGVEIDNLWRYGPVVLTISFETYGRIGQATVVALTELAAAARCHGCVARALGLYRGGGPKWSVLCCMPRLTFLALGHQVRHLGQRFAVGMAGSAAPSQTL